MRHIVDKVTAKKKNNKIYFQCQTYFLNSFRRIIFLWWTTLYEYKILKGGRYICYIHICMRKWGIFRYIQSVKLLQIVRIIILTYWGKFSLVLSHTIHLCVRHLHSIKSSEYICRFRNDISTLDGNIRPDVIWRRGKGLTFLIAAQKTFQRIQYRRKNSLMLPHVYNFTYLLINKFVTLEKKSENTKLRK